MKSAKKKPPFGALRHKLGLMSPSGLSPAAEKVYIVLRLAWLALMVSIIPLSYLYWRTEGFLREGIRAQVGVAYIILILWACLYFILTGMKFPKKIGWGLLSLASLLANGVTGASLAGYNPFFGAYQVLLSSLSANVLFCALMVVYFLINWKTTTKKNSKKIGVSPVFAVCFFTIIIGATGYAWWVLKDPYYESFILGRPAWAIVLCLLSVLLQVFTELKNTLPFEALTGKKTEGMDVADYWLPIYAVGAILTALAGFAIGAVECSPNMR